ncbi:TPA: beta-lactamase family protein [Klebsiella variicola]|nr:beta-lactamase family protein [Klebsiella variicola]
MQRPLISRPGKVFAHVGPGFQVVGAVVEVITGKRWSQVFHEKLTGPLGMMRPQWMHPRRDRANDVPVEEILNPVLKDGAVSTAEDYLNFLSMIAKNGMFAGQRILSPDSINEMLADQTPGVVMTSTGNNILADVHYALGNWCESGITRGTAPAIQVSAFLAFIPGLREQRGILVLFFYLFVMMHFVFGRKWKVSVTLSLWIKATRWNRCQITKQKTFVYGKKDGMGF